MMTSKVLVLATLVVATLARPDTAPAYSAPSHPQPSYSAPAHPRPSYSAPAHPRPSYSAPAPGYSAPTYPDTPPQYSSQYAVKDDYSGNDFGHDESRDGYNTQGSYYALLPDSRLQKVNYYVNGDSGYVAEVSYEGEAQYSAYQPAPAPSYGHAPAPSYSPVPAPSYRPAPAPSYA
ncbi:uncharacterized protein [Panulirus ornatus]|uniref:uncharacterized protein n=1 Tax=Panulirus ornatus TaxID=150431 RepID=UPI003A8779BB